MMNEFNKTTKNIVLSLCGMTLILLVFGYFFRDTSFLNGAFGETTFLIYTLGVLFGVCFSIIKVFLIRFSLMSALNRSKNKATMVSFGHFLIRYVLTGVILYISIKVDTLDFFGTILGVLALQPASYLAGYLIKKNGNSAEEVAKVRKELDL